MGIKIVAKAPTVHQLNSLVAFGMQIQKQPDGSFTSEEEFPTIEGAKEFLKERAIAFYENHFCDPEEELQAITVIEKYGILTLDAVTGYVITEDDEQQ